MVEEVRQYPKPVSELSLAQARVELDVVEIALAEIKAQRGAAKARFEADGERSDPIWFARATAALRMKGARHQHLLRHIAALRRAEGPTRPVEFGSYRRALLQAAQELLTPEQLDAVLTRAAELKSQLATEPDQ